VSAEAIRLVCFDFNFVCMFLFTCWYIAKAVGGVTALALSYDHTYVAAGYDSGHIQLYDLSNPQTPARSVTPTSLAAVSSGRQEGHLSGSRIVSIGFVGGRHTAVVSADENGLAFYHSLGKVLFVDASDILRILGKYPDQETVVPPPRTSSRPRQNGSDTTRNGPRAPHAGPAPERAPARGRRTRYTILGMAPLPLGTSPHPTDLYNIVALLTPAKLVIVGLKPTPRTWFKCPREVAEESNSKSRSRWKGTLAWFPSVLPGVTSADQELSNKKGRHSGGGKLAGSVPMLVYSWGNNLYLIRVSESRIKQSTRNMRTGKVSEVDVGTIVFEEAGKWSAEEDILAVQWLNVNVGSFIYISDHWVGMLNPTANCSKLL
jgi:vacuolar protein sorting-associated protein 8